MTAELPPVQQCAPWVAPTTMQAVLHTESAMRPLAIGTVIRRGAETFELARQPRSRDEAVAWAGWLMRHGYRFDAGIAQVHSTNFAATGLTPQTAFDPCASIAAGGAILTHNYLRAASRLGPGQAATRAALSAYNTGSFTAGLHNGYVARVERAALRLHSPGSKAPAPGSGP